MLTHANLSFQAEAVADRVPLDASLPAGEHPAALARARARND